MLLTFLELGRDQRIKAGDASRTEAAKAQMQVERADWAAALAEEKMKALEEERKGRVEAEKQLAGKKAETEKTSKQKKRPRRIEKTGLSDTGPH